MINEPFAIGNSVIHRLDPRFKIIAVIAFSVATAVAYGFPALVTAFAASLVMLRLAGLALKSVAKRLVPVNGFVLMFWLILPFTAEGEVLYRLGPAVIYQPGIVLAAQITLKSNAILMALIALLATMRFATLGQALNQLKFPEKFVFLFMLTYRYIFVLEDEYKKIWRAIRIRGFSPGTSLHCYKTYAYMIGMLFIRAAARADRVYRAMQCRGFQGRFHTLAGFRSSGKNWIFAILMAFCLLIIIYLEWTAYGI